MNKNIIVLFVLAWASVLWGALPMENVGRYNIILVHGAADRWTIPIAPQTYFD
jgi:hypothetical protein